MHDFTITMSVLFEGRYIAKADGTLLCEPTRYTIGAIEYGKVLCDFSKGLKPIRYILLKNAHHMAELVEAGMIAKL